MSLPLPGERVPAPPRLNWPEVAVIGFGLFFVFAQVKWFNVPIEDASVRTVLIVSGLIVVMLMPRTVTQLLGMPRTVIEVLRTVQELQTQLQAASAPAAGAAPTTAVGPHDEGSQPVDVGENR